MHYYATAINSINCTLSNSPLPMSSEIKIIFPLLNLTLGSGEKLFKSFAPGLGISASIYNLFDQNHSIVAGQEYVMTTIPQNGTNYRIVFSYKY